MALNLFGQQEQPDPYGYGIPSTMDQLLAVQPLQFTPPPPPPTLPAAPAPAPGQDGSKIAGNAEVMGHLQTVMQAAAAGHLSPASATAPKGLVRSGETVKTVDDGLTPAQRAQSVAVRGQADLDTQQVDADRQSAIATAGETHAAKLRAQAAVEDELRVKAEAENDARMQRIREHQEQLAEQKDEPVNPNRYFENMSTFSKGAAILSAFSYGFLNPKNQGVAPIMQQLTQMASEDTRAQIANNQEGRARRGDLISLYERRYGDASLVQKKLEADKLQTLGKKAMADADDARSAQAKAAAQDLGKKLLIQADVRNQQVSEAYAAKPVAEVTTTYKAAAGAGDTAKNYEKWAAADKALEAQGVSRDDPPRVALRAHFGITASKNTVAEQTDKEQSDAAAEKQRLANDKFAKMSPEEKKDARTKIDGLADVAETLDSMAGAGAIPRDPQTKQFTPEGAKLGKVAGFGQTLQDAAHALPWHVGDVAEGAMSAGASKEANDMRRQRDTIAAGLAKAEFARTTEFEFGNEQKRIPLNNPVDLVSGLNYAEEKAKTHYRNAVGQYGQDMVDRELRERGIDPARFR